MAQVEQPGLSGQDTEGRNLTVVDVDGPVTPGYSTSRVEAFSDGVLAIAITLLVRDLRPPEAVGGFRDELIGQCPSYLAHIAKNAVSTRA